MNLELFNQQSTQSTSELDSLLAEAERYNLMSRFKVSKVAYVVRRAIPLMKTLGE